MAKRGTIGIDVGGTKTLFALFDEKFAVVEEIKVKTQADKGEKEFTRRLVDNVEELAAKAKRKDITLVGVGVGCAGVIDADRGTLKVSPNIPFLKGYPFRDRLSKLTGANVVIANDVHAGLYGEHQLGAAKGRRHVIGIFIGTGIGGALIIDGRLYTGADGIAGDIGNYVVHLSSGGNRIDREQILDGIASRTAMAGEAAALATKQWAPHLLKKAGTDVSKIRSGDLAESIEHGDRKVEELVRSRARTLGVALSNMVDFLNPEMVVIGGGLTDAMPALVIKEVKAGIEANTTPRALAGLKVVASKLKSHAVTTGAAKFALDVFALAQKGLRPT